MSDDRAKTSPPADVTAALQAWSEGDPNGLEQLSELVFDDLRRVARGHFRNEPDLLTLEPTALVSELFVQLLGRRKVQWNNRRQFFGFASKVMRRILVDHARRRRAQKRGAGKRPSSLDDVLEQADRRNVDLVGLDDALEALGAFDQNAAQIVEMKFFVGLTHDEIAELLEVSPRSVRRKWQSAKLWLFRELSRNGGP